VDSTGYKTDAERNTKGGWGVRDGTFTRAAHFSWRNPGFRQNDADPVVNVSWNDARALCRWLGSREAKTYRLPTEAEWEYACRAGTMSPFFFGDACNGKEANCDGTHPFGTTQKGPFMRRTSPVGSFRPNAFGLSDMSGNANQWCSDWYDVRYPRTSPVDDPRGPETGTSRAVRGGGWANWPVSCRSAERGGLEPSEQSLDCGFRVVCEITSGAR
jgi:formylglycine-generating enzyme required for sulfatase activity